MIQDDYKITDENRIAWCKMCTLAPNMKDCANCPLNIGLPFRATISLEKRLGIDLAPIKQKVFANQSLITSTD